MNHNDQKPGTKTWWGPVWRGLVVDAEARHYHRMKSAFWLFVYLVIHANRHTGELRRKYATIAQDMGLAERTIRRWLERLRQHNYVRITPTGRSQVIHIQKWKALLTASKAVTSDGQTSTGLDAQSGHLV